MLRIGFLLGFSAVLLQIAVFLQPLLPKQFQIAPVCETITRALFEPNHSHDVNSSHEYPHFFAQDVHSEHANDSHTGHTHAGIVQQAQDQHQEHHHDINHQCQYCTVFGNLVLPPDLNIAEVIDRIQVRLIAFEKAFKHVYFQLQRLYLLPQGRAPPHFA